MNCSSEILKILIEAGREGLSVKKISRHVYNAKNTFFNPISYGEVYKSVQKYLLKQSSIKYSIIERLGKGIYRFNEDMYDERQMKLEFREGDSIEEHKQIDTELRLNLFDE